MYTLCVQRTFKATHHLIGGDWGPENLPHSHDYRLELRLEGEKLDEHGYLVDIVDVERHLDEILGEYDNVDLNKKPAFAGLNPSLEHFSHIICLELVQRLDERGLASVSLQLWESHTAWARYQQDF